VLHAGVLLICAFAVVPGVAAELAGAGATFPRIIVGRSSLSR